MRVRNIVCLFLLLGAISIQSFCMEKRAYKKIEKKPLLADKVTSYTKEEDKSRGKKVFESLAGYVKRKKEKRREIIKLVAANVTYFSLDKATKSVEDISKELTDIPYVGSFFSFPGISLLTNIVGGYIISKIVDFDNVNKNKDTIKDRMEAVLKKDIKNFKVPKKEYKGRLWFKNKITNYTSKKEEHKKMYADMLYLGVYLVKYNEEAFKKFIKIAKADKYHKYFYKKLCTNVDDIENKIKISCDRD